MTYMNLTLKFTLVALLVSGILLAAAPEAKADAVTDWNVRACDIVGPVNSDTPMSNRMLAIMHTAIYEAVNAITKRYPRSDLIIEAPEGGSLDAAIAAASRITLLQLLPSKEREI